MKRLHVSLLLFSSALFSSCGVMVDNSVAPPPVAAQAGDLYFDGGVSISPVAGYDDESRMNFKPAFSLGVGSALNDFDFLYTSVQANMDLFTSPNRNTNASIRYYRKLFRTGNYQQFVGGHYQFIAWNDDSNSLTANALGLSYMIRANAPGGTQPYLSVMYGIGAEFDIDNITQLGTLSLGVQHRFNNHFEARVEFNQNMGTAGFEDYQWGGGLGIQARYLF